MPSRSKTRGVSESRPAMGVQSRRALQSSAVCSEEAGAESKRALLSSAVQISAAPLPALATRPRLLQRTYSTLSFGGSDVSAGPTPAPAATSSETRALPARSPAHRNPDRISLDRRGLTSVPPFSQAQEASVRLLSLQHNLISRLDALPALPRLVFLDLYDNQVERLSGVTALTGLRVLLLGKNRIRRLESLEGLSRLEVLDLHGNQLGSLQGVAALTQLKVLNAAGNQLRGVAEEELRGLSRLQELNLRRNRLRSLLGLARLTALTKLFLSNNCVHSPQDLAAAVSLAPLQELSVDGNAANEQPECSPLLVSVLPQLRLLNGTEITSELRAAAAAWRATSALAKSPNRDKDQVISNARMHWQFLRSKTKSLIQICSNNQEDDALTLSSRSGKKDEPRNLRKTGGPCSEELAPLRLPPILAPLLRVEQEAGSASSSSSTARSDSALTSSSVEPNVDSCTSSPRSELTDCRRFTEPPVPSSGSSSGSSRQQDSQEEALPTANTRDGSAEDLSNPESKCARRPFTALPRQPAAASRVAIKSAALIKPKHRHLAPREKTVSAQPLASNGHRPSKHKIGGHAGKTREQGGDFLVEIEGHCLNIYGQAAIKFLDRSWNPSRAAEVTSVRFNYISFNSVATQFAKLHQRFPSAEHFIFREANLYCLAQLNALAELQGLCSLTIEEEGNPLFHKDWQSYAVYRLGHWGLRRLNGVEVDEAVVAAAEEEYRGLGAVVLDALPGSLLLPLLGRLTLEAGHSPGPPPSPRAAKEWLCAADPTLRNVVAKEALQWRRGLSAQDEQGWRQRGRVYLSGLLEAGLGAAEKLVLLEQQWPGLLVALIQETLVDYAQMDLYMKRCMAQLRN